MKDTEKERIEFDSKVYCSDGVCGDVYSVVVDPVDETVTDIVVRLDGPSEDRIVPASKFDTAGGRVQVEMTKADLRNLEEFLPNRFVEYERDLVSARPAGMPFTPIFIPGISGSTAYYWPYVVPLGKTVRGYRHENLPEAQRAIKRGARVEAKDGLVVGVIDELIIDPDTCSISHLVLRTGPKGSTTSISIPKDDIDVDKTTENTIKLKIDKADVDDLAPVETIRRWSK